MYSAQGLAEGLVGRELKAVQRLLLSHEKFLWAIYREYSEVHTHSCNPFWCLLCIASAEYDWRTSYVCNGLLRSQPPSAEGQGVISTAQWARFLKDGRFPRRVASLPSMQVCVSCRHY
eukprot:COSAG05_NODE_195_length_14550_cov_203.233686_13_plen_118_part_00